MLPLALIALAITSLYSIAKAPIALRVSAAVLFTVPAGLGYAVAYFAATTEDTRVFYPIAGAIAGWIVGAVVFDTLRKRHLKNAETSASAT
jgi:hypothetical protein